MNFATNVVHWGHFSCAASRWAEKTTNIQQTFCALQRQKTGRQTTCHSGLVFLLGRMLVLCVVTVTTLRTGVLLASLHVPCSTQIPLIQLFVEGSSSCHFWGCVGVMEISEVSEWRSWEKPPEMVLSGIDQKSVQTTLGFWGRNRLQGREGAKHLAVWKLSNISWPFLVIGGLNVVGGGFPAAPIHSTMPYLLKTGDKRWVEVPVQSNRPNQLQQALTHRNSCNTCIMRVRLGTQANTKMLHATCSVTANELLFQVVYFERWCREGIKSSIAVPFILTKKPWVLLLLSIWVMVRGGRPSSAKSNNKTNRWSVMKFHLISRHF